MHVELYRMPSCTQSMTLALPSLLWRFFIPLSTNLTKCSENDWPFVTRDSFLHLFSSLAITSPLSRCMYFFCPLFQSTVVGDLSTIS